MAFLFYGLAAIEGMIMRTASVVPSIPPVYGSPEHYFSIMTVHPIVGIFGSTYQLVFGAFNTASILLCCGVHIGPGGKPVT